MIRLTSAIVGHVAYFILLAMASSKLVYAESDSPQAYKMGDPVPVKFNKFISSYRPLTFAYDDLPFVCPRSASSKKHEGLNIGQILQGDSWTTTDHQIFMGRNESCKTLCTVELIPKSSKRLVSMALDSYKTQWIIDNAPVYYKLLNKDPILIPLPTPFVPLVHTPHLLLKNSDNLSDVQVPILNHLSFFIDYLPDPDDHLKAYIVAVTSTAISIEDPSQCTSPAASASNVPPKLLRANEATHLTYSYSVFWRESSNHSPSRWDNLSGPYIHWRFIWRTVYISILITGILAAIMAKKVRMDIQDTGDSESRTAIPGSFVLYVTHGAWKSVHADVFRSPRFTTLLIALLAFGAQFACTLTTLVLIMMCGFLGPAYRGGLMTIGFVLYPFFGLVSGFVTGYMHSLLQCQRSLLYHTFQSVVLVPGFLLATRFTISCIAWADGSSLAIPFGTWTVVVIVAFGVNGFFTMMGAIISRRKSYTIPVEVSDTVREVPPRPWFLKLYVTIPICALLPYVIYMMDYTTVVSHLWSDEFYWVYGYLALITLMTFLVSIESTLTITYLCLNYGDYHWWWRSFIHSASSAIGIMIISSGDTFSGGVGEALMIFGYSLMGTVLFAVLLGTLGFLSTFMLLRIIYSSIKSD
ncbi:uncharacterized protein BYT42DRAFT_568643 [Radiomyces spectabilis]|uniref:uncharacterized protein n=1 Tax=Radiomyces spectabilis TaxID=64574 RepID=UPI00221FCDC3|nr:uncharacterized protein BYT42DRAFT_568643 [Radiomyces spectabilis]KAI8379394.1 hypothetical protein BYT42DRAFT_568643 [Radiomyces spectabilis]